MILDWKFLGGEKKKEKKNFHLRLLIALVLSMYLEIAQFCGVTK